MMCHMLLDIGSGVDADRSRPDPMDIVSSAKRSAMMSAVRSKDTAPELLVRKGLHARGLRYWLHCRQLPGRPDLVFPKWHAAVLVHGCFWHGHGCRYSRAPGTNQSFWRRAPAFSSGAV